MHMTGLMAAETMLERTASILGQVREVDPDSPAARALELTAYLQTQAMIEGREAVTSTVDELLELLEFVPTETFIRRIVATTVNFYLQEPDRAAEILEAGLLIDPLSINLFLTLSNIYIDLGRYEDAREILMRAIEIRPGQPGIYFRLARLARHTGDMLAYLDWYRRGSEVDPQDPELPRSNSADSLQSSTAGRSGTMARASARTGAGFECRQARGSGAREVVG